MLEVLRLVGQLVRYAAHRRSIGLLLFVLAGGVLLLVVITTTFAAPVLIYPLL